MTTPETPTLPSLPPELREKIDDYASALTTMAHSGASIHAARAALDAALLTIVRERDDWQEWASHQEWCRWCSEGHPRNCTDGALLWARCHVNDGYAPNAEEAQKIVAERDPRATTPEETPAHER